MKHFVRATKSEHFVYTHCGFTLGKDYVERGTGDVCMDCVGGKERYDRRVQDGYNEFSTRKSTDSSPFTRD